MKETPKTPVLKVPKIQPHPVDYHLLEHGARNQSMKVLLQKAAAAGPPKSS